MSDALPTPAEMAVWDRETIRLGLSGSVLMENAAREVLHVLWQRFAPLQDKRILLLMGGGNNGGDAACLARHLLDAGARPLVVHTRPLGAAKGDAGRYLRLARRCGVPFLPVRRWLTTFRQTVPDLIIDGLLGTGFGGTLRQLERVCVQAVNELAARTPVVAIDIPSGLSGLTGLPSPEAVRATLTVTFEAAKPGLILPQAAPFVGELLVRNIGIPRCVRETFPPSFMRLTPDDVRVLPEPGHYAHKGKAGHVLIVGGCERYAGAPQLAARGAARTGAGLITLAAPETALIRMGDDPTIMRLSLPGNAWRASQLDALAPAVRRCSALVVGPGMGREPGVTAFLEALLALPDRPHAVIDADGLVSLSPETLARLQPTDVLTPHPGEAAQILGWPTAAIQEDRTGALRALMERSPAIWILKGAGTLIASAGKPIYVSGWAEPNLAVGGSGDVLAGCLGALIAQGVASSEAARAAVCLHAMAGHLLRTGFVRRGNTALDIAEQLPRALVVCQQDC